MNNAVLKIVAFVISFILLLNLLLLAVRKISMFTFWVVVGLGFVALLAVKKSN